MENFSVADSTLGYCLLFYQTETSLVYIFTCNFSAKAVLILVCV